VSPCQDFYAFSCGGWLAHFALPPDRPQYSRSFTAIEERNLGLLRALAAADGEGRTEAEDRYPEKVGAYWGACMGEGATERGGLADLRAAWARIDAAKDVPSLASELGRLHRDGVFPAFEIGSAQDARDATQVIGVVAQGGLSLPDRDYYLKDDAATRAIQEGFRAHVARMLELAGEPAVDAGADRDAVYALERALAEAQWSRVELRDPRRTYNRLDLSGLERSMPGFPWPRYLAALGHPDLRAFSATTPAYLTRLDTLLGSVPVARWRAYLRWHLLAHMAEERALPDRFTRERFRFTSQAFTGATELEPRWKHCVRSLDRAMGEAIGQAYVRRYFGADGKERASALVAGIEAALSEDLGRVTWLDAPTRARAREKLARVVNKIGYPAAWRNYDALRVDRGSFFTSVLAAAAFETNRDLDKIGKPLDRGEWSMSPPTVNAYYDPSMNEIVFPAGILQPPFFHRRGADAVNAGGIGMVMGHELTHGFDDEGRRYDALGNLVDWWTPAVSRDFDHRAACIADQFDAYTAVDDVKLNGKLTLGENIADLGGLELALSAYRASRAGKGREPALEGFTPEQAFFVAFAQVWCTAIRPEYARLKAATDPHAPPRWRVNGPLSNMPAFREAFACPAGSAMVRSDRCALW
jgi:endothelin-converting enzyme/putative endopeptidase